MNTTNGIIDGSRGEITPTSSAKSLKSQHLNFRHGHSNTAFIEHVSLPQSYNCRATAMLMTDKTKPSHRHNEMDPNFTIHEDLRESHITQVNHTKSSNSDSQDGHRFDQVRVPSEPDKRL